MQLVAASLRVFFFRKRFIALCFSPVGSKRLPAASTIDSYKFSTSILSPRVLYNGYPVVKQVFLANVGLAASTMDDQVVIKRKKKSSGRLDCFSIVLGSTNPRQSFIL